MKPVYSPSRWGEIYHALPYDEVLGGGAAGPGKSLVLLMDPMQQIVVEHQRMQKGHPFHIEPGMSTGWALHLRRTIKQLEQNIIRTKRIFPIVDPGAKFDEQKTTWTFTSGYRFQFGHCQNSQDWQAYLSGEFTHIGYDELVTFLEEQYENINLRLRSTDPVLRKMLRIRAMTNPMVIRDSGENYSIDPYWVRKRFVDPAPKGGVVLEERTKRSTGQVVVKTRFYSHATLYDNPDPEFVQQYEAKLLFAKPHIRAAMLHGNWYVTAGSFFGDEWNERMHVIRPHFIPPEWPRFRSMDWGYKKPGCVQWYAMDPDENLICEREMMFQGQTARQVAERVKKAEMSMKLWKDGRSLITGPADTQLWEKRGDEGLSKAEEFAAAGIQWVPADKRSRSRNAERVSERLKDHDSGTAMPGLVFFETCKDIVKMLPTIQTDKDDPDTPQDGGNDHSFDTLMYACAFASRGRVGIPRLGRKEDDEYGDESEDKPEASRGNSWGYGSAV